MTDKKLSLSIRINRITPTHTSFQLFVNLIPQSQEHSQATRASTGNEQTLRNEEIIPFLKHIKPHLVSILPNAEGQIGHCPELGRYLKLHTIEDDVSNEDKKIIADFCKSYYEVIPHGHHFYRAVDLVCEALDANKETVADVMLNLLLAQDGFEPENDYSV